MALIQAETTIENFLSDILANGSDDQLFASGYLQGHLDLILQSCFQNQQSFIEFIELMEQSLAKAYGNNELAQPDRLLVEGCWQQLKNG